MTEMESMGQTSYTGQSMTLENPGTTQPRLEREGKYLTFAMAEEEYGIGILKVKEIVGMQDITPIPETPEFVKGVINLRGKVIPIVDLRLRFAMAATEYNERTCIIVVEVEADFRTTVQIGIVVDSVSEVSNIKGNEIEDTPAFGTELNTNYILGIAKTEGSVKILLDIDSVLSGKEISSVGKFAGTS